MKTSPTHTRLSRLLAAGIAVGAGMSFAFAAETPAQPSGFREKAEQWQNKMSEAFRDTWKSLRSTRSDSTVASASVDLREQKDNYVVRLNLPDRDLTKVEITLQGETLRVVAPGESKAGRYEQTVTLAGAESGAKLTIERKPKDDLIVVTIPKRTAAMEPNRSRVIPDPALLPLSTWDSDFLDRMTRMNREMDRIFDDAFGEFRLIPEHKGFFDIPRFGSSVDLKEEGSYYVISAYLPEREIKDVNVTVEDQTLKIMAKSEESTAPAEKGNGTVTTRKSSYSQILTLPGPVQADKVKVERKEGMLTVTLPKA